MEITAHLKTLCSAFAINYGVLLFRGANFCWAVGGASVVFIATAVFSLFLKLNEFDIV
jgi:hypothetical protein